jgi:hypothetical protein
MKWKLMILLFLMLLTAVGVSAAETSAPSLKNITIQNKVKITNKEMIPETVAVPNVVGLPHAQAVSALEQKGLEEDQRQLSTSGDACKDNTGKVVTQNPTAGTRVSKHTSVMLGWCR